VREKQLTQHIMRYTVYEYHLISTSRGRLDADIRNISNGKNHFNFYYSPIRSDKWSFNIYSELAFQL